MLKKLGRHHAVQAILGWALAEYLRFVYWTSHFHTEPEGADKAVWDDWPCIIAMWHGQHFLVPFLRHRGYSASVLISRHGDGEINARAASRLGLGLVRGSGDHKRKGHSKGGLAAFRELVRELDRGRGVALTADVPKVARKAGLGIVMLARETGRAIIPVAVATSRRAQMHSWDKASFNLPFSRGALVVGEAVRVAPGADEEMLEAARQCVEDRLNAATARAYDIVDKRGD